MGVSASGPLPNPRRRCVRGPVPKAALEPEPACRCPGRTDPEPARRSHQPGFGRRARHDPLAPPTPPRHHRVDVDDPAATARAGLIAPAPKKRPKSTYIRFVADLPNECWQSDFTHWRLADGTDTEILTWLDDHSRYALSVTAHRRVTGKLVVDTFHEAATRTVSGMLIDDLDIRVIDTTSGEILRQLILDPTRDYQPHEK